VEFERPTCSGWGSIHTRRRWRRELSVVALAAGTTTALVRSGSLGRERPPQPERVEMNNVIYIVGLVVVVGAVLSWVGFH
jgi:hypothetical protein